MSGGSHSPGWEEETAEAGPRGGGVLPPYLEKGWSHVQAGVWEISARLKTSNLNSNEPRREGETDRDKNGSRSETHGEKMPTSFTVVPVDDGRKSARKDTDENNVLKEEDEEAVGELCPRGIFCSVQLDVSDNRSWSVVCLDLSFWRHYVNTPSHSFLFSHTCDRSMKTNSHGSVFILFVSVHMLVMWLCGYFTSSLLEKPKQYLSPYRIHWHSLTTLWLFLICQLSQAY